MTLKSRPTSTMHEALIKESVPQVCPAPVGQLGHQGFPQVLMFRFPRIPGVPWADGDRSLFAAATKGAGRRGEMPRRVWESLLNTLGSERTRAEYHLKRFDEILDVMRKRRELAGGPVVSDFEPALALYFEAAGFLTGLRTFVDVVVRIACMRLGESGWEPSKGVFDRLRGRNAKVNAYSSSEEIRVLRKHRGWYQKLNDYRNCMNHSGRREEAFGYFERGDSAAESNNHVLNVMLLPDQGSLKGKPLPHEWTYRERVWLDATLAELHSEFEQVIEELLDVWKIPQPPPGTLPYAEQPNVLLTLPVAKPLKTNDGPMIPVFRNPRSARAFMANLQNQQIDTSMWELRSMRCTRFQNETPCLLAYDPTVVGDRFVVSFFEFMNGSVVRINGAELQSGPDKPLANPLPLRLPEHWNGQAYILDQRH